MSDNHKWTKEDDIVAFYLAKYPDRARDLRYSKQELSERMGMSLASLDMRIGNFHAVAGKGGLPNFSKLTSAVYQEYKDMPDDLFRDEVIKIIEKL